MIGAARGGASVAGVGVGRTRPERRGAEETGAAVLSGPIAGLGGVALGIAVRGLAGAAAHGRNSNFVPQRGQTRLEAPLTDSASKTWVQTGLGQGKVDGMAGAVLRWGNGRKHSSDFLSVPHPTRSCSNSPHFY